MRFGVKRQRKSKSDPFPRGQVTAHYVYHGRGAAEEYKWSENTCWQTPPGDSVNRSEICPATSKKHKYNPISWGRLGLARETRTTVTLSESSHYRGQDGKHKQSKPFSSAHRHVVCYGKANKVCSSLRGKTNHPHPCYCLTPRPLVTMISLPAVLVFA